jgi:hypothetical protein
VDVDEASVRQPPLGNIAVQANRAAECIHGFREFTGPMSDVGILSQGAIVAVRSPVYLDLFEIAVVRLEMSSGGGQPGPAI